MNRGVDLWLATVCSVGLHVAAYAAFARLGPPAPAVAMPLFKLGESSVALTIMPSVEHVQSEKPDAPATEQVTFVDPEPESENDTRPDLPTDADLAEKGVRELASETVSVRPRYPLGSRLRNEEGRVRLRVLIGAAGGVNKVEIVESSGYRTLDKAAAEAFWMARFPPAPVAAGSRTMMFAVQFRLDDR